MQVFNSFNEMAIENGCTPYVPGMSHHTTDNMSPKVQGTPKYRGKDFGIGMNELQHGGVLEPPHTHIMLPEGSVKVWLAAGDNKDTVAIADWDRSVHEKDRKNIAKLVAGNRPLFMSAWVNWAKTNYPQDPTIKEYDNEQKK
jgi:hypothetical protein